MDCKVGDLCRLLEALAPPALAASWDRIGLQMGNPSSPVTGVLVALDPSPGALEFAAQHHLNFLVTHHPLFFRPLERVVYFDAMGRLLKTALQQGIHIFAAHTNLDAVSPHGINDLLCERLHLQDVQALEPAHGKPQDGLGRVGRLAAPQSLAHFVEHLKEVLGVAALRFVGEPERQIQRLALCSGSGASLLSKVYASRVDCYLTGDLKYHEALEASQNGLALVDPGHFALEIIVVPALAEQLRRCVREKNWSFGVEEYKDEKDPFCFS